MTPARRRVALASCLTLVLVAGFPQTSWSLPRTWIGGNVDWVDAGSTANWNPADEPDSDDEAIFNTANAVNLGSNNAINGLTMSAGIDLSTNNFDLTVDGLVQLTSASTNLFIGGATGSVNADNVTINASSTVELRGGLLTLDEEVGTSNLDIVAGGTLSGNGSITFADTPIAFTTVFSNDGTLTAFSRPAIIFNPPPVGTLQISTSNAFELIDLDGSGNAGVVNVNRNQTLDVNGAIADAFGGTMTLFHNSRLDMSNSWGMNAGTLTANNGFVAGGIGVSDIPADISVIAGGTLTQTAGTITVPDADGTLRFDAPFTMNGGNFVNNGLVIFNANATIAAAANFTMPTLNSSITVATTRNVTINQTNFDVDGGGGPSTSIVTVESDGLLTINVSDYDDDAVNRLDGIITLNSGDISFNSADAETIMDNTLNLNFTTPGQVATWSGEPLDIGDDGATGGVLDANVNVAGAGVSRIASPVDFNSDADVNVAAGAIFDMTGTVNFDTVNGANNAEFTGTGIISFTGQVNVNEPVTLNMVGGTVDFDGADGIGDFINVDAPLVVHAATLESFGKVNGGGGTNTLDVDNLNAGNIGSLTVILDSPTSAWSLDAPGALNLINDNAAQTLLSGSDVNLNGTVTVAGDVRTAARVDIGSTGAVNVTTGNEPFRLAGGDNSSNPNTISGGLIAGVGLIAADAGKALHGFGTINAGVDFDGTANLKADNGTLTVNGALIDVNVLGTADVDGVLNVVGPWNTSTGSGAGAIGAVVLAGGGMGGGVITNDNGNGIQGFGLVTSRVFNNTKLVAANGPVLAFQTVGNNNDWDGVAGTGQLIGSAATLELRDVGQKPFTGTASAVAGGKVLTNGFSFDFSPASTIDLTSGTLESTSNVFINGAVTVSAGTDSTIKTGNANFLDFNATSSTTLTGNLRTESPNVEIAAGATFSGTGALVLPAGSSGLAAANANINVLFENDGLFRPAGFDAVGRVDVKDYQQGNTGGLFAEITGTALNQFDRLVVNGAAQLGGYLNIDIDGPFVPVLNQTFNVLTATAGISGAFDYADTQGMPAGLTFQINYLANAVQLKVVATPFFSADFDHDGDVDPTDLAIWKGAFNLNQLGDADGDNDSDGNDFLLWQRQFGSVPAVAVTAAVPEPASLLLVLAATTGLGLRRGRRRQELINA